jgi:CRP-like cAMP-binding protein
MNCNKLEQLDLFGGLNSIEIRRVYDCFGMYTETYNKGDTVFTATERRRYFGVIIGGKADVFRSCTEFDSAGEGELIGELSGQDITVTATDRLTILHIPATKLLKPCTRACNAHSMFIGNYIAAISNKAVQLQDRIDCLNKPNVREKALAYLLKESNKTSNETGEFDVSRTHGEIAEYLCTTRVTLSRALMKLKTEGMIDYDRSLYKMLQ